MLQALVYIMQIVLFSLIAWLMVRLFRAYQAEKEGGQIEVSIMAPAFAPGNPHGKDSSAFLPEAVKQLQIFWSTQWLEFRLNGMQTNVLQHPKLNNQVLEYSLGVADAVADHFECHGPHRSQLYHFSAERGVAGGSATVNFSTPVTPEEQIDLSSNVYQAGYQAAADWVAKKALPKATSLYSIVCGWGLII